MRRRRRRRPDVKVQTDTTEPWTSPQSTPPPGVADNVVATLRVEVVVIRHVVSVHLTVHEVVVTFPGLPVQRLKVSEDRRNTESQS